MLKTWEKSVDSSEAFGDLLQDLPKAFYCLNHELVIGS